MRTIGWSFGREEIVCSFFSNYLEQGAMVGPPTFRMPLLDARDAVEQPWYASTAKSNNRLGHATSTYSDVNYICILKRIVHEYMNGPGRTCMPLHIRIRGRKLHSVKPWHHAGATMKTPGQHPRENRIV